jgi:hypothetical protein
MGKTLDFLQKVYDREGVQEIEFKGTCHDCGSPVSLLTNLAEDGALTVKGGAMWFTDRLYAKCEDCFEKNPVLQDWQSCEVYSRVVGYMRPVGQWNKGKQAEWSSRVPFKVAGAG